MIRRSRRSLHRASAPEEEGVNPNNYISGMSDCMLVLAVGLLVALVASFGLDLQKQEDQDTTAIEVDLDQNQDGLIDENYTEAGKVYYDSETGNYYMLEE